MKLRFEIKYFNATINCLTYLLVAAYSCAYSQSQQRICERGNKIAFSAHDFSRLASKLRSFNFSPASTGISLGYFFGNNLLKTQIRRIGYYESTRQIQNRYYQYEGEILLNFHLLEYFDHKNIMDIYLVTGANFTHLNFDKNLYANPASTFNRLGQVAGIGAEYIVRKGLKQYMCLLK